MYFGFPSLNLHSNRWKYLISCIICLTWRYTNRNISHLPPWRKEKIKLLPGYFKFVMEMVANKSWKPTFTFTYTHIQFLNNKSNKSHNSKRFCRSQWKHMSIYASEVDVTVIAPLQGEKNISSPEIRPHCRIGRRSIHIFHFHAYKLILFYFENINWNGFWSFYWSLGAGLNNDIK